MRWRKRNVKVDSCWEVQELLDREVKLNFALSEWNDKIEEAGSRLLTYIDDTLYPQLKERKMDGVARELANAIHRYGKDLRAAKEKFENKTVAG